MCATANLLYVYIYISECGVAYKQILERRLLLVITNRQKIGVISQGSAAVLPNFLFILSKKNSSALFVRMLTINPYHLVKCATHNLLC